MLSFRSEEWLEKRNPGLLSTPRVREELDDQGLAFAITNRHREYFAEYYQGTYHTLSYIKRHWGSIFELKEIVMTGQISIQQDVAVLRKY